MENFIVKFNDKEKILPIKALRVLNYLIEIADEENKTDIKNRDLVKKFGYSLKTTTLIISELKKFKLIHYKVFLGSKRIIYLHLDKINKYINVKEKKHIDDLKQITEDYLKQVKIKLNQENKNINEFLEEFKTIAEDVNVLSKEDLNKFIDVSKKVLLKEEDNKQLTFEIEEEDKEEQKLTKKEMIIKCIKELNINEKDAIKDYLIQYYNIADKSVIEHRKNTKRLLNTLLQNQVITEYKENKKTYYKINNNK